MDQRTELLEKYNDKLSAIYDAATSDREHPWTTPAKIEELMIPYIKPGCEVLDVGVGTGKSSKPLSRKGCLITGIDISGEMIEETKSKFPEWKLYRKDMEKGLDFLEDKKFDIIIASGVLEFVSDIGKTLKELSGLLKPSGKICFTYEKFLEDSKLQKWEVSELGKNIADPIPELLSFFVYRHKRDDILSILEDLGLKMLKEEEFIAYHKTSENIPVIYDVIVAEK